MDPEWQRAEIVEFYRQVGPAIGPGSSTESRAVVDNELGGMLAIWDDACSAHDDPWLAVRNECSMYRFEHAPWSFAATSENFLLTLRAVLEGRGHGISDVPYDIR